MDDGFYLDFRFNQPNHMPSVHSGLWFLKETQPSWA